MSNQDDISSNGTTALNLDDFDPPEFLLAKLNSQIREMMNSALRQHGLKLVEWRILQCLTEDDRPLTVAELAELTVIDRTVASRLIEKMVAKELITKTALQQDRRYMNIEISPKGTELFETSLKSTQNARTQLFDGLTSSDLSNLLATLNKLQSNIKRRRRIG